MRYMIGFSTPEFSTAHKVLPILSGVTTIENEQGRRCTRYATLDGGCDTYDTGYSAADREFQITVGMEHKDFILELMRNWRIVLVSAADGYYKAMPRRFTLAEGRINLQLYITEQIA
jgi:hypothetical protein